MSEYFGWLECPFCHKGIHSVRDVTAKNRLTCPGCSTQFPIYREFEQHDINGNLRITYGEKIERGKLPWKHSG